MGTWNLLQLTHTDLTSVLVILSQSKTLFAFNVVAESAKVVSGNLLSACG